MTIKELKQELEKYDDDFEVLFKIVKGEQFKEFYIADLKCLGIGSNSGIDEIHFCCREEEKDNYNEKLLTKYFKEL